MILMNAWHVAAMSAQLTAGKPLGCTICHEPVATFRQADDPLIRDL